MPASAATGCGTSQAIDTPAGCASSAHRRPGTRRRRRPYSGTQAEEATRTNGTVLKFNAVPGRMRASLRRLDERLSTPDIAVQSLGRAEKLRPGEIVRRRAPDVENR